MADHALLSASGSHIWLKCLRSPLLSEGIARRPSRWADEGTQAHALAEKMLAARGVGIGPDVPPDEDETLLPFVDHCEALARTTPVYAVEKRVYLDKLFDGEAKFAGKLFGTADFVAFTPDKTVHVVDLKFGQGVVVEPRENTQLMYYALGVVLSLAGVIAPERVRLTIIQPRASHPEGPVRSWDMPLVDLLEWGHGVLAPTIRRVYMGRNMIYSGPTFEKEFPLVEGDHCRWCAANDGRTCPAKRAKKIEQAQAQFDEIDASQL